MTSNHMISLDKFAGAGKVRNLSGKERGIAARVEMDLDALDLASGTIDVVVPDYLDSISPSFFQGLFSESIAHLKGKEGFLEKYKFKASDQMMRWIDIGIRNATSSRERLI